MSLLFTSTFPISISAAVSAALAALQVCNRQRFVWGLWAQQMHGHASTIAICRLSISTQPGFCSLTSTQIICRPISFPGEPPTAMFAFPVQYHLESPRLYTFWLICCMCHMRLLPCCMTPTHSEAEISGCQVDLLQVGDIMWSSKQLYLNISVQFSSQQLLHPRSCQSLH